MTLPLTEPPLDQPYYGAPFGAAVTRFVKKGFTFTGRASLSEYWYSYLAVAIGMILLSVLAGLGYFTSGLGNWLVVLVFLVAVAVTIPQLAVTVRRLHDAGLSGGMYFMSWIPFAGGIILLVMLARPSDARGARFDVVPAVAASTPGTRAVLHPAIPAVPLPLASMSPAVPMPSVPMPASAPAVPLPSSVVPVPAAATVMGQPVEELESTRLAPTRTQAEWQMALGDGRRLAVASALRVGRDPIADPAFPGTVLVPIVDPAKSLSKTHAQLEASPGVVVVTDLHSTNGTKVRTADGSEMVLAPEVGHRVTGDAEISFGDYIIRLHRQA